MSYGNYVIRTPQNQPLPHKKQVENNAGGYVFAITRWERLERFLILGSDQPTYYQSAQNITRQNASCVLECFREDAERAASVILGISMEGRAPRQKPVLFALALASTDANEKVRDAAFSVVPACCGTASSLFLWMRYRKELGGGSGRAFKRTLARWYEMRSTSNLAYQMIKYRDREGYSHKRAIELSGRGAKGDELRESLYLWARGKDITGRLCHSRLNAFLQAQAGNGNLPELIAEHRLPWEALPTESLRRADVWQALIPHMGLTGLIRNLGRMTDVEAISRKDYSRVVDRIVNEGNLKAARVHPFQLLLAQKVYSSGHGDKGSLSWNPVGAIVDALDTAFYLSFKTIEPTGKRYLLALDVSGSMGSKIMGSPLTCREAACAMSLVTMATEPHCDIVGFTAANRFWNSRPELTELNISPKDRLDQAVKKISRLDFGATDCALPMTWALKNNKAYDAIITYTDNESWAGPIHASEALRQYRQQMKLKTKFAAVAFTATSYSVVDPADGGSLNFVGFDSSAPAVMADFFWR
jgi:60 kDa SS-A/Ro ribonucleoprotein